METKVDGIEKLSEMIAKEKSFDSKLFHKTKLLLKIYKDVVWRAEDTINDLDAQSYELGGRRIAQMMDFLSFEFNGCMDVKRLEKRLMYVNETKILIEIIDKSLLKLYNYPDYGKLYFEIISRQYIFKQRCTERELLRALNIERTMFYRRKKEAINLTGVILWGYILPPLRDYWSQIAFREAVNC